MITMTNYLFFGIITFNPHQLPLIYTLPPRITVILKPLQLPTVGQKKKKKPTFSLETKFTQIPLKLQKQKPQNLKKKKGGLATLGVVGGNSWWPNHP
jgi:hypothetical protein